MLRLGAIAFSALLLGVAGSARAAPNTTALSSDCLQYKGHTYEVCFAFAVNCTAGAMLPYFKYGRSANAAISRTARNRLESRYTDRARQKLETMVNSWPPGDKEVSLSQLRIISAKSSLVSNTATLVIRWSWGVFHANSEFSGEINARHTITMHRVPGLVLHKWVVTSIR